MGCLYAAVPDPSFGRTACDVPGIYWCQTHNRAASICQSITEAIASEREACAVLAESSFRKDMWSYLTDGEVVAIMPDHIAAAIRARSNE